MNPDYYVVLHWRFKEEFIELEEYAWDIDSSFIFTLTSIEI